MSLDTAPIPTRAAGAAGPPEHAVVIKGLVKQYRSKRGAKTALDHIDLAIPRGSLFGLLGPNGAGKSTLINIMAGLVLKTQGEVRLWGIDIDRDPRQARAAIGVVPQELTLDAFFSPREQLELQAGLYGVPKAERRTDEILAAVGLSQQANAYARTLSGGMRRRLLVAKALVHSPPILVLDEPTAGVDVELRQQLWDYVRRLNREGVTILLTTHYLEEAEELCDRVAIIDHGRLIADEPTRSLLSRFDSKTLSLSLADELARVPPALAALGAELLSPRRLAVHYRPSQAAVGTILEAARADGLTIVDVSTEETSLEDVFLQLTRGARKT
jgi:ABC-2 type transport system ATP-binding protein